MLKTVKVLDKSTREALYSGTIIKLKLNSATALCNFFTSHFLDDSFTSNPHHLSTAERIAICEKFETSTEIQRLYTDIFKEAGLTNNETHWDRLRLRVQHSGDPIDNYNDTTTFGAGKYSSTLPIHRDTWGSQISQQLNWWMPLKPLQKECTLLIYPSYFNVPVPNLSKTWSLKELKKARKNKQPYPQLPTMDMATMLEKEEWENKLKLDAVPILIQPGEILIFSGSHLHGSAVGGEAGSFTRFSTEVRTINVLDCENGIGATNVDGPDVPVPQKKWFHPLVLP